MKKVKVFLAVVPASDYSARVARQRALRKDCPAYEVLVGESVSISGVREREREREKPGGNVIPLESRRQAKPARETEPTADHPMFNAPQYRRRSAEGKTGRTPAERHVGVRYHRHTK